MKETIKSLQRIPNGLNFEEAQASYLDAVKSNALEFELQKVIDDPQTENMQQTSSFWILAKALKCFYTDEGKLPVSGVVPDMVSTTESFLTLQRIYVTKGNADKEKMRAYVDTILTARALPKDQVKDDELDLFCKNC